MTVRRIKKVYAYILAATVIMATAAPVNAAAETGEEPFTEEITDIAAEDAVTDDVVTDDAAITAIEQPDVSLFEYEFKPALERLLGELPDTVTVLRGEDSEDIEAVWVCDGDYDENLGEYRFVPDMSGYTLAEGVEVPYITVTVEKEICEGLDMEEGDALGFDVATIDEDAPEDIVGPDGNGNMPSSYNLFEAGKLPSVRDQGSYNTCWAHATIGAVESDLITDGSAGTDVDLSEIQLAYYDKFDYDDPKGCRTDHTTFRDDEDGNKWLRNGGSRIAAARMLANLIGAVSEEDARYSAGPRFRPNASYVTGKDSVQIRNAYYINVNNKDAIKSAIMEHGGVAVSYRETNSSTEYSATYNSYYCTQEGQNHAVMLVGWNDAFPRANFNVKPAGDGAWLVRNSYGDDGYGHFGYFWLSYYDKSISGDCGVAYDASTDTFDHCYAYDGVADRSRIVETDSTFVGVSTVFDVDGGEAIKGVSFEFADPGITATITATIIDPETGNPKGEPVEKELQTTHAGIYTAEFDTPLEIVSGQGRTEVQVRVDYSSANGSNVRIVCEDPSDDIFRTGICDKGFVVHREGKADEAHKEADLRVKLYTDDLDQQGINDNPPGIDYIVNDGGETVTIQGYQYAGYGRNERCWKNPVIPGEINGARVTAIQPEAFRDCDLEGTLTLPGSVRSIGMSAFYDCRLLKGELKLPANLESIGEFAFYNCVSLSGDLTVPEGVKQIPKSAFGNCGFTGDLNLPSSLTSIGENAFYGNTGLSKIRNLSSCALSAKWFLKDDSVCLDDGSGNVITRDGTLSKGTYTKKVNVSGVSLDRTEASMVIGQSVTLKGTVIPARTPYKNVRWQSSKPGVAKVSSTGVVTGVSVGTADITVTTVVGNRSATCRVTVNPILVSDVTLSKTASVVKGNSITLKPTVSPSNATNKSVTWNSSNTGIATVSSSGVVKGIKAGTVTITCTAADGSKKSATCKVTVNDPVKVKSISLNKKSLSLIKGKTFQLKATVSPKNAAKKDVTWKSSNKKIATVSSKGVVKGIKAGTVTITCTAADGSKKTATCKVTVKNPVKVKSISLNKKSLSLKKGKTFQMKATVSPKNATKKDVTWKSSNKKIATVSSKGVVKGIKAGTVTITCTAADGSKKTAACKVTVK